MLVAHRYSGSYADIALGRLLRHTLNPEDPGAISGRHALSVSMKRMPTKLHGNPQGFWRGVVGMLKDQAHLLQVR